MPLPEHNLEREFALLSLTLYLREFPDRAAKLAINYYEEYIDLADDYKNLCRDFEALQIENARLKRQNSHKSVSLPHFLNPK